MGVQFHCKNENRRQRVAVSGVAPGTNPLNGIDYLEVVSPDQKTLAIHFLRPLPGQPSGIPASPALTPDNLVILGGVRTTGIKVELVTASNEVLTVAVNARGDFSRYTLRLVKSSTDHTAPDGFDPQLAEVEFSFKVECPSEFDCHTEDVCPPELLIEPDNNYLAKDYASFRRLMLDRLSVLMPDWRERSPADLQVALVELLAYVGDQLSYFQDAVGTEAYLGTARKRVSVRRHARLLDYFMHDGCNARAWVNLEPTADNVVVPPGTALFVRGSDADAPITSHTIVFETMHDVTLRLAHHEIHFYTWSDTECCLPKGATRATLKDDPALALTAGDLLLLEESRSPTTGLAADADSTNRQVVRLIEATPTTDPLDGTPLFEIAWDAADALTFPLCLTAMVVNADGTPELAEISVARGNIVLADHGRTVVEEAVAVNSRQRVFYAALKAGPITQQGRARDSFQRLVLDANGRPRSFDPSAPAAEAMRWQLGDTLPVVELPEAQQHSWLPLRDLFGADRFTRGFVTEIDERARTQLRFGDDILGLRPAPAEIFKAVYRIGNGRSGNVGAGAINAIDPSIKDVKSVRNPLPAEGGVDPESLEAVRQFAPEAFRVQERAVTEADWAEVAERHPEVQQAAARFRWTGSWFTVFVTIDRRRGEPVDAEFVLRMRAHLERYRIAGYDLEVKAPRFVPLDLLLHVCVKPGYRRSDVKVKLLAVFSNHLLDDGNLGFFHPDNFTFGQPVYLSQIYRAAMGVAGVASAEVQRFQRWGEAANDELDNGLLAPAALEIIRLDNDPNFQENGRIEFELDGGL